MGRHDFSMVYTDTSEHAAWRATAGTSWPWDETPAFATLPYFTLAMIRIDWMHTFHMGVCRDLLGSALRIMASSRHWFNGRNIEIRLKQIYRAVKKFAKEQNKQISIKRLTKKSLGWGKQCPEFKGSAADSGIFLMWLAHALLENPPPHPWEGLLGVAWCADRLCSFLMSADVFLSSDERRQTQVLGSMFLDSYSRLACEAHHRGLLLWRMRPKFHYLQHALESSVVGSGRNPCWDACWLDEDYVRWAMKIFRKAAHKTACENILRRTLVMLKYSLSRHVEPT